MAALAAGVIVALRGRLVNCLPCSVFVREAVQLASVEGNSLLSNADFGQVRACFLGEHAAAHALVGRCLADSDESGSNVGHLSDPPELDEPNPRVGVPRACAALPLPECMDDDAW